METIELQYPITLPGGVMVNSIMFRRPKVRDLKTAQQRAKTADEQELILLSLLCEPAMTPEDLEGMDLADYGQFQRRFQAMVGSRGVSVGSGGAAG